jgi:hypothetical protein
MQPDLSGALFVIAIAEKFNLLTQFLRNDKKAGILRQAQDKLQAE